MLPFNSVDPGQSQGIVELLGQVFRRVVGLRGIGQAGGYGALRRGERGPDSVHLDQIISILKQRFFQAISLIIRVVGNRHELIGSQVRLPARLPGHHIGEQKTHIHQPLPEQRT